MGTRRRIGTTGRGFTSLVFLIFPFGWSLVVFFWLMELGRAMMHIASVRATQILLSKQGWERAERIHFASFPGVTTRSFVHWDSIGTGHGTGNLCQLGSIPGLAAGVLTLASRRRCREAMSNQTHIFSWHILAFVEHGWTPSSSGFRQDRSGID